MGRDSIELRATAALSRHNSKQDDLDNACWNLFVKGVKTLAEKNLLFIDVIAQDDLPIDQWGED